MNKKGLVLEGGGMRGLFSAGVMDAFLEHSIHFDGIIGVSAGALFGCNYKSGQKGRALRYNIMLKDDSEYMGIKPLFKTGNIVNAQYAYHIVPFMVDVFDKEAFDNNPMEYWVVCTDIESGEPLYHRIDTFSHYELEWMRASASMPVVSRPVKMENHLLLDGGMTDSIPLEKFQTMGYGKNIVILTQPHDFKKQPMKINWLISLLSRKYPKVGELMKHRHEMYNKQLDYIVQQEKAGNAMLIYPDKPLAIGRTELNESKMRKIHQIGYDQAKGQMSEIIDFLQH